MRTISLTITSCPRCQRGGVTISTKHPLCARCQIAVRQEAAQQQERDYLARYLSTRDDDHGRAAMRLRALAKRQGVDWHHAPATMLLFDARVAALTAPYTTGNKRGRPARRPQVQVYSSRRAVSARATSACVPEDP